MKILTVVGARPQFIKAAALSAELSRRGCVERVVHTGQHYDFEMSKLFFDQLRLRNPDHFLEVGSASHAIQTAEMMKRLEPIIEMEQPAWVVVFGDTNSTLAGALVAAKSRVPLAHVEAGLRSFNRDMPEEINRIVTDHVSSLLLAPTHNAAKQLQNEGISSGTYVVGDLMVDLVLETASTLEPAPPVLGRFKLRPREYALVTVHRASNTEDKAAFHDILSGLRRLGFPVIFPVHPRTVPLTSAFGERLDNIAFCEPLSYRDTVALEKNAKVIVTDSGGIQKEAYALGIPCVTLRNETEWIETLVGGWNVLAGTNPATIEAASQRPLSAAPRPNVFGSGQAATRIADLLTGEKSGISSRQIGGLSKGLSTETTVQSVQ